MGFGLTRSSCSGESGIRMRSALFLAFLGVIAYGIALAAAIVMLQILARPWRRSVGQHWTERARLAYAPGMAVLLLAVFLSGLIGMAGGMAMESMAVTPWALGSALLGAAAFSGALTVRYIWLRELWGPRVTFRTWVAGCLLLMLGFIPGLVVVVALLLIMPDRLNAMAVYKFCAGVLAVTFFALGGGLRLLRLLGIARPAPAALSSMVQELAQKMNAPSAISVFVLEWAHVNALAWPRFRAIGFAKALLEVMTEHEVRAVAAHELAHLLEPKWVMRVRTAYMFAYLPLVPLVKYGG